MLINNFFYLKSFHNTGDNPLKYLVSLELNAKHPIFEGHFPGMPVTPGVCLVQMVKEVVGVILEKKLMMTKADNIKFMAIVNPLENNFLSMDLSIKPNGPEHWVCDAITFFESKIFFKLKAHYVTSGS